MKYSTIFFLSFFISTSIISQDLNVLKQEINKLEKNDDVNKSLEDITALKRFVDYKYYSSLKENIMFGNQTKDEKDLFLINLNRIPLGHFRKSNYLSEVGDLYMWATKKLILQRESKLEHLEEIQIKGMYYEKIKPFIKPAILRAGGKWPEVRNSHLGGVPLKN